MSFWLTLLAVVVGGGISAAVVWWVTPAVSRKERRDERREEAIAQIQVIADTKLKDFPERMKLSGLQLQLVSDFQGWRQKAELYGTNLGSGDESFQFQSIEIQRCVDIMYEATNRFIEDIRTLPTWFGRIGWNRDLRYAWNGLANGARQFNWVFFQPTLLEKVDGLADAETTWMSGIERAIDDLVTCSLQQLGHLEPARPRRTFRLPRRQRQSETNQ
jgi:hypothetical protein